MKYSESILNDVKLFFYSNDNVMIDYKNMTINDNDCGDTYYKLDTYTNNEIKSILVCAKNEDFFAYVEFYIINNDLYETLEHILNVAEETEERLNKQFERNLENI